MTNPTPQQPVTFEAVAELIWKHLKERDWHHNPPKGLAISIALEAGELLEHYQWQDKAVGTKDDLGAELADILIYAFQFAEREGIDMVDAITRKLEKSAQKYPANLFKGQSKAAKQQAWLDAKLHHRKEGL